MDKTRFSSYQDFFLNKVFFFVPPGWGMVLTGFCLILYGILAIAFTFFPELPSIGITPPEALFFIGNGFGLIFTKRSHMNLKREILSETEEIKRIPSKPKRNKKQDQDPEE